MQLHGVLYPCCIQSRSSRRKAGAGKRRSPSPWPSLSSRPAGPPLCSTLIPKRPPASGAPGAPQKPPLCSLCSPTACRPALATAAAHGVDVVVIDTPARSELAALEAARVADLVVIPCRPQRYDLETIPETQQVLSLAGGVSAVVVLSAVAPRGPRTDQARAALTSFGLRVCPATLGSRAAVGDAGALGLTATEFQPRGRAAQEARAVAQWITEILETGGPPDA